MNLEEKIKINTHYTRSVNLERDANSVEVIKAYIPTSRALRTFEKITNAFSDKQAPRAWSLVGPCGSGKSTFAVFLSHLLSNSKSETTKQAQKVLNGTDKSLGNKFQKQIRMSDGYLKVLITGAPEPMSKRLLHGLFIGAKEFWDGRAGRKPAIIKKLEKLSLSDEVGVSEVLKAIVELQSKLIESNGKGILLLIDELGKFLEYEARHYGANDIYLLQSLAEHACKGSKANLMLFVMLHQSFEQYAKGLGESLKNEWSKVQGRFEEVPFLESAEQVLRIVSAAFEHKFSLKEDDLVSKKIKKIVSVLHKQKSLPGALSKLEAEKLFKSCYPLHPVSAILLPMLCQKVAQNERTLFSYLGSHEEFGLSDMLEKLTKVGEFVHPHEIYDYFITNQPAVLGDYMTHRRWAEVVTAVERIGDVEKSHIDLLKTIGIMNIIGAKGGFKASTDLLQCCSTSKKSFEESISFLRKQSVINYRSFSGEFRVWQGSDFDLEEALQEELDNLGNFSLAEELNKSQVLQPIVARRFTIEKGNLRYFMPLFVDAQNFKRVAINGEVARIVFFQATAQDDEKLFHNEVKKHFSNEDIVVLCLSGSQIKEAVAESIALRRVGVNKPELNLDPVAKREYKDRLTASELVENGLLQSLIDIPEKNQWHHNGERLAISNKRMLQQRMSEVLENIYHESPIIFNELVNRDKPSAQANAGRRQLLLAMLKHPKVNDLAIDKFPPEKSIYRALLNKTGLHKLQKDGSWAFSAPTKKGGANLYPTWQRIDDFFETTENEAKTILELNQELLSPPYGVKAGILPILYMTYYFVNQHEIAVYESRRYLPFFSEEMLERFVKRPDEFTFQRMRIEGVKATIFRQYAKAIVGEDKSSVNTTILEIAKPLAIFMSSLPDFTKKTKRGLSKTAQKVRSAFDLAKSPERLLFQEIPKALGFNAGVNDSPDEQYSQLSSVLTKTLRELNTAYEGMINKEKELLAISFNLESTLPLLALRKLIAGNCHGLEHYTVDTVGVRAFIMRLVKSTGSDDDWLENILMFLGHKPTKKWTDGDQDTAEYRLNDFSRRVTDLEKLRLHDKDFKQKMDGDFDVYLLRSVKKGAEILDEVVAIDKNTADTIEEVKFEIKQSLAKLKDSERALAVLAKTVDEFLLNYRETKNRGDNEQQKIKLPLLKEQE